MVKLSVIIPAFNEQETILELLREVKAQMIDGVNIEVVVIDDCSVDNTLQLLDSTCRVLETVGTCLVHIQVTTCNRNIPLGTQSSVQNYLGNVNLVYGDTSSSSRARHIQPA